MKSYTTPGHVLQIESLWAEIKKYPPGLFLDAGCGIGLISNYLLQRGWQGIGVDLNNEALSINKKINQQYIERERYECVNLDFLKYTDHTAQTRKYDLVLSSNVIEHLEEALCSEFIWKMRDCTSSNGIIIIIVPGSPEDWGIEDEVVGHIKRYTIEDLKSLAPKFNLISEFSSGMTYPLGNLLLPISNYLVRKNEGQKTSKNHLDNTIESSLRKNYFKTEFPAWTKLIINKYVLFPFIILQKIFKKHPRSLQIIGKFSIPKD